MARGRASGVNWIVGGLASAILVPALAIGAGMPFWIAAVISLLAGSAGVLLLAPRRPFESLDAGSIDRGSLVLARELLSEADPLVQRLDVAANTVGPLRVRRRIAQMAETARGILDALEKDPARLGLVQRFLTYYLPRTVEMAEGYHLLEQQKLPDAARLQATGELLDRLDGAFSRYADAMLSPDVGRLDIELKLLGDSLDDDLGPVGGRPALPASQRSA